MKILHQGSAVAAYVTVSVGVACIAEMPETVGALARDATAGEASPAGGSVLIEAADHALYEAKFAGRNRVIAACDDDGSPPALPAGQRPAPNLRRVTVRDHDRANSAPLEFYHVGRGQGDHAGHERCMSKVIDDVLLDIFVFGR